MNKWIQNITCSAPAATAKATVNNTLNSVSVLHQLAQDPEALYILCICVDFMLVLFGVIFQLQFMNEQ